MMMRAGSYLTRVAPEDGRARLFCFHFAGGGASAFAGWPRLLRPYAHVCPVQLPGRESRGGEPRFTDVPALIDDLALELDGSVGANAVFYGHSMGAMIAFELTRRLAGTGRQLPAAIVAGACPAPHLPTPVIAPTLDEIADEDLARALTEIGGLPRALLDHPEWLAALLPIARDDLRLCMSHAPAPVEPLPTRIATIAGRDDPLVAADDVAAWRSHAGAGFDTHVVAGGHLFIKDAQDAVIAILVRVLLQAAAAVDTASADDRLTA